MERKDNSSPDHLESFYVGSGELGPVQQLKEAIKDNPGNDDLLRLRQEMRVQAWRTEYDNLARKLEMNGGDNLADDERLSAIQLRRRWEKLGILEQKLQGS